MCIFVVFSKSIFSFGVSRLSNCFGRCVCVPEIRTIKIRRILSTSPMVAVMTPKSVICFPRWIRFWFYLFRAKYIVARWHLRIVIMDVSIKEVIKYTKKKKKNS